MTGFAKSNEKERKKHTSHWDFTCRVLDTVFYFFTGMTNLDGSFQIEVPYTVNRLVLGRAIGFEDTEIILCESCNYLEIILFQRPVYDFLSKKQVDKKRKKRFKKIGKIRKEAVKRGIFQSKTPCYKQVFIL